MKKHVHTPLLSTTVVSALAVIAVVALWAESACGGKEPPVPLALYAGEWNEDDARLDGTFVQDGPCLYVDSTNAPGRWFVAFGVEGTSWDEDERAVSIPGATYRVGAEARVGGGESGVPAGSIGWAIPPAESCDTGMIWMAARP
ncbi:MAG: hypothetical protein HY875_01290 [Chloroflexi bacterium]|nr:hypothetical protein [Chloroflexota bacterium]